MPVIPQYRQQEKSGVGVSTPLVHPERAGASARALAQIGAAVTSLGETITAEQERKDKLQLQADVAVARSDLTTELHNDVQSGAINSDDYVENYQRRVQDRLEKLGEGRLTGVGRQIASAHGQALAADFAERANQAKSVADGQAAVGKFGEALNFNRNTLLNDPTQFNVVLEDTQRILSDPTGPYGRMASADRAKLMTQTKEQLALSAVQGSISILGPEFTKKELTRGAWDIYLTADKKEAMLAQADQALRMQDAEAARLDAQRDREERRRDKAILGDFVTRMIDPATPADKQVSMSEIARSGLSAAGKEHAMNMVLAQAKDPDQGRMSDPVAVRTFQDSIFAADGDPAKIYEASTLDQAYIDGKLNRTDLLRLRSDLKAEQNDSAGFHRNAGLASKTAYNLFTKDIGLLPSMAEDAYYRWRKDFDASVQQMAGKGEDPRQLLDPNSKNYALDPLRLAQYAGAARQAFGGAAARMQEMGEAERMRSAKPGETVEIKGKKFKRLPGDDPADPKAWQAL